uniref:START domain-containing protein n=1 Tax=Zea mays TaxID=4577 RepID=A0A804P5N1_MAIZE
MLSSSTSRRESKSSDLFRAAAMALRDAANKTAGIEPNKAASNNNVATVAAVSIKEAIAAVRHEGWMVRYGRRKIGRVEDRGLKTLHGQMIYVLCIYNKKEKEHQITMGAYDIEDAMAWKKKIELIIDQQQDSMTAKNRKAFASMDFDMELGGQFLFSDHDSTAEDDEERPTLTRKTTIGNGPPDSIHDWTKEPDIGVSNQNDPNQFCSKKNWRLLRCQNGLRIFEELLEVDYPARGCSRAMRAVGVVEATCEAIFGLIMSMDVTRYEWDCSFRNGSLVEEVDGHTAILYHRLHLHWCPMLVWPRDLCYARYWRRNDDGSYVVLFRSTEHLKCGRRRGFVRAFIESGGFKISPLKCRNGRPRTQYHSLLQILNCVAGLCEYFSQTDDIHITPRIPVMESMFDADSEPKNRKLQEFDTKANRNMGMIDEESDDDDDYQVPEANIEEDVNKSHHDIKRTDEPTEKIDLSCFLSILHRDPEEKSRNCWTIPDSKIFKVRSKNFPQDKSKIPAASYLMELAAIDWFKDTKRMDNVARQKGCVAQVAADRGMHTFVVNIQLGHVFCHKYLEKGILTTTLF